MEVAFPSGHAAAVLMKHIMRGPEGKEALVPLGSKGVGKLNSVSSLQIQRTRKVFSFIAGLGEWDRVGLGK